MTAPSPTVRGEPFVKPACSDPALSRRLAPARCVSVAVMGFRQEQRRQDRRAERHDRIGPGGDAQHAGVLLVDRLDHVHDGVGGHREPAEGVDVVIGEAVGEKRRRQSQDGHDLRVPGERRSHRDKGPCWNGHGLRRNRPGGYRVGHRIDRKAVREGVRRGDVVRR
jgi:hypothetical protein